MPYKERTNLPVKKSTYKILLKRKMLRSAEINKDLSWDEFLLEATEK